MKAIVANAYLNLKEVPNTLYIRGSFETQRPDDRIKLVRTTQPANPGLLITEIIVVPGSKPAQHTVKHFKMNLTGDAARTYREFRIRYHNGKIESAIQDVIEVFGSHGSHTH